MWYSTVSDTFMKDSGIISVQSQHGHTYCCNQGRWTLLCIFTTQIIQIWILSRHECYCISTGLYYFAGYNLNLRELYQHVQEIVHVNICGQSQEHMDISHNNNNEAGNIHFIEMEMENILYVLHNMHGCKHRYR